MLAKLHFVQYCFLMCMALQAQSTQQFQAEIHINTPYTHPIGHGLFLVVDQADAGTWNFHIKPSPASPEAFTDCLASPFLHGPDTEDLSAWRFAPDAPAGYAQTVPLTLKVPFVTNAADHRYECAESDAVYNSFQASQSAGRTPDYSGLPHYKPRPRGQALILIPSITLKPGLTGTDAEFKSATLQIKIVFPKTTPRHAP